MSGHDVIVVGAGPNGLTAAAALARAGRRVVVLEQRDRLGGRAAGSEFHPGFRGAGVLHDTTGLRRAVIRELDLVKHGLALRDRAPGLLALGDDGRSLYLDADPGRAAKQIAGHSPGDAESYPRFRELLERLRPLVAQFVDGRPLDLIDFEALSARELLRRGLRLRRLGRRGMLEFLRLPPMSVADWLDEWFESGLLKAALAHGAIAATFSGPRSPGTNSNLLLRECSAGPGISGGAPALVEALRSACQSAGVDLRTKAAVNEILLSGGTVAGVRLAGDETVAAPVVACACEPKRALLTLLPRGALPSRTERRLRQYRTRGTTAQVLLAVKGPVRFGSHDDGPIQRARTGGDLDQLERAFDAVKYRTIPETPILDVLVPTVSAPELAPAGHSVISILAHFVPDASVFEWDDSRRERLADRAVSLLARHVPGLERSVLGRSVLAPPDLEREYAITGGQIHHGEHALDQLLVRPAPECSRYRTPVPGLYLCGGGTHPGGELTLAPGAHAAAAILDG